MLSRLHEVEDLGFCARGDGGRLRQVEDARNILVSGLGMISSQAPLSTSMAVFAR